MTATMAQPAVFERSQLRPGPPSVSVGGALTAELERVLVDEVARFVTEAESGLDRGLDGRRSIREAKIDSAKMYLGEQYRTRAGDYLRLFVINKTQNATVAQAADQNEKPAHIKFEPVETGEPPTHYAVSRSGAKKLRRLIESGQLQAAGVTPDLLAALGPATPVPPEVGEELMDLTEPGPMGEPPVLVLNEDVFAANDATKAAVVQSIFDLQFQEAFGDYYVAENSLWNNIVGDCPFLFQWDTEKKRGTLRNPSFLQVLHDPLSTWIENSRGEVFDQYLSAELAARQYPWLADAIRGAAKEGTLADARNARASRTGTDSGAGTAFGHVDFNEPIVTLRTWWKRDYAVPMTVDEAVESGAVIEEVYFTDRDGEEYADLTHQWPEGGGWFSGDVHDDWSRPLDIKRRYRLASDGRTVAPRPQPTAIGLDFDGWPTRRLLLQRVVVVEINRVVEDSECPYAVMPLPYSKCVPIPFSPWGMGMPMALEDVNCAINMVLTVYYNWIANFAFPVEYWPQSIYDAVGERLGSLYHRPGLQVPAPDGLYERYLMNRQTGFAVYPPPPPEGLVNLLQVLLQLHDQLSNNLSLRQGFAPTPNASGTLAETLLTQSKGISGYKAMYTEWSLEWIGRLWRDAILDPQLFPDDEWKRHLAKYPPAIRGALRDGARTLKYDVRAEVVTGRGAVKAAEKDQAMALHKMGVLSDRDLLEGMNYPDPKGALRRRRDQDLQQAAPQPGAVANPQPIARPPTPAVA